MAVTGDGAGVEHALTHVVERPARHVFREQFAILALEKRGQHNAHFGAAIAHANQRQLRLGNIEDV